MPNLIARVLREPLLHFLLIGALLFVYYGLTRDLTESAPKRIHLSAAQVAQLKANFQRSRLREPSPDELAALIEAQLREEVFYREALAMGLDQDDPLVRRRLRMKFEFILEDLSAQNVSDEKLIEFFNTEASRFQREAQIAFFQVYVDHTRREDAEADALALLDELKGGADPASLGDATLLAARYPLTPTDIVSRDFGREFVAEIGQLPTGKWQGPIASPFGYHLVFVEDRVDALLPDFTDVRDTVLREYLAQQRKTQLDAVYQRLREDYEITVETMPGAGAQDPASTIAVGNAQ